MAAMNEILASQMSLNSMAGTGSLLASSHPNGEIEENGSNVKMEDEDEEENENNLNGSLNCEKILSPVGE